MNVQYAWYVCFALISTCAYSHSFVVIPKADWRSKHRAHCRRGGPKEKNHDDCHGPCISNSSWFYNVSASANPTTWERGDRKQVIWTRNGHRFGFIRLTLVPISKRMSFAAHEKYAFHYSCFESNPRKCDSEKFECGTDEILYVTNITVPSVPDGDYVLGWSWYGAAARSNNTVSYNFGDYWSCSFIRIQGGTSESDNNFVPKFKSGTGEARCKSLTNRLHVCPIEPCKDAYGGKPVLKYFCPYTMRWDGSSCRFPSGHKTAHKDNNVKKDEKKGDEDKKQDETKDSDQKKKRDRNESEEKKQKDEEDKKKKQRKSVCSCPAHKGKDPQINALMLVELDRDGKLKRGSRPRCLCAGRRSQVYVTREQRRYGLAILALARKRCNNIALLVRRAKIEKRCRYSRRSAEYGAILGRYRPKLDREIELNARADHGSKFSVVVKFKQAKE